MAETKKNNKKASHSSILSSLTIREIRKLEDAAATGDLDAQRRLADIEGVESYDDYKPLNQQLWEETRESRNPALDELYQSVTEMAGVSKKFPNSSLIESLGLTSSDAVRDMIDQASKGFVNGVKSSTNPSALKQIADALVDKSSLREALNGLSEQQLGLVTTTQNLADEALRNLYIQHEDHLPTINRADASFITSIHFPTIEERIAQELTQNTLVNREILDEMRKQSLEKAESTPTFQGEPQVPRTVNVAFDILDAATERFLSSSTPNSITFKRDPVTTASVAYYLSERDLGFLGTVTIRKTGEKKSEIQINHPSLPEDRDVIQYHYHEFGWRIEDGSYLINGENGSEIVHESELIPLAEDLQQKRLELLLENIVPSYFENLSQTDIWPIEEKQEADTVKAGQNSGIEDQTIENTRIPAGKYDDLCKLWVTRPYIPKQTKDEFLDEHASELDKKTFDRILKDAYKRNIISKENGRYKPKTVS